MQWQRQATLGACPSADLQAGSCTAMSQLSASAYQEESNANSRERSCSWRHTLLPVRSHTAVLRARSRRGLIVHQLMLQWECQNEA